MELTFALAPLGVVAVTGLVYLWMRHRAGMRARLLRNTADGLGLSFSIDDLYDIRRRTRDLPSLGQGEMIEAFHVLRGKYRGRTMVAFDCKHCDRGFGPDRSEPRYLSVVLAELPDACFPDLLIRPERLTDKIAEACGAEEIDFDSHEFSSRFWVQAENRKFAYDVVNDTMMSFLLAGSRWTVELGGSAAAISNGHELLPSEIAPALDFLCDFLDRIPRYVRKDLGAAREATESGGGAG
jgi:hypothetical protein